MHVFHGRCYCGTRNYYKLQQLEGPFREEVLSRYDILPVVWSSMASSYVEEKTMYKLVRRGDASTFKKVLNRRPDLSGLDLYDFDGFEPDDMQSPSSQATTVCSERWGFAARRWELAGY